MEIKNIIFDFDGTLVDTTDGIVAAEAEMLRLIGLPPVDRDIMVQAIGLPLRQCLKVGCLVPEEKLDEAVPTYRSVFDVVATPLIKDFPGVRETLEELNRRGVRMAIATSRGSRSLEMILNALDINKFFELKLTADNGLTPKPAPDMVLEALRILNAKDVETLVVGDTTFDLDMGKSAGCRTCGVTYGNHGAERLATSGPDYIIDNMESLLSCLS